MEIFYSSLLKLNYVHGNILQVHYYVTTETAPQTRKAVFQICPTAGQSSVEFLLTWSVVCHPNSQAQSDYNYSIAKYSMHSTFVEVIFTIYNTNKLLACMMSSSMIWEPCMSTNFRTSLYSHKSVGTDSWSNSQRRYYNRLSNTADPRGLRQVLAQF